MAIEPGSVESSIGHTKILIPAPLGFGDSSERAPQFGKFMEAATHPAKKFLAGFISESDLESAKSGRGLSLDRYFVIESLRQSETLTSTAKEFEQTKALIKGNYKKWVPLSKATLDRLAQSASAATTDESGVKVSVHLNDALPVGMFGETKNSIGITTLGKYSRSGDGEKQELTMVVSITTALIKGKYVYLQACSVFNSSDDVEWTRQAITEWLRSILSSNRV